MAHVGEPLSQFNGGLFIRREDCAEWEFLDCTWVPGDEATIIEAAYAYCPGRIAGINHYQRFITKRGGINGGTLQVGTYQYPWDLLSQIVEEEECGFDMMVAWVCAPGEDKTNPDNWLVRRVFTGMGLSGLSYDAPLISVDPEGDNGVITKTYSLSYAGSTNLYRLQRLTGAQLALGASLNQIWPLDEPSCGSVICMKPKSDGCEEFVIAGDGGTLLHLSSTGTVTDLNGNLPAGPDAADLVVVGRGNTIVVGVTSGLTGGFAVSSNRGTDFVEVTTATDKTGASVTIGLIAAVTVSNGTFYAAGADGHLYRSFNGRSWVRLTDAPPPVAALTAMSFPDQNWGVVVGPAATVLIVRERGNNILDVSDNLAAVAPGQDLTDVFVTEHGMIMVVGEGGFIATSTDYGNSWQVGTTGTSDDITSIAGCGCERVWITTSAGAGVAGAIYENYTPADFGAWTLVEDPNYIGGEAFNNIYACDCNKAIAISADGYPVTLEFVTPV